MDAAWERFKAAPPSTWTTLFETEAKTLTPLLGQTGFKAWKGQALQPWHDLWQTEMAGVGTAMPSMTFSEWLAKPANRTKVKPQELLPFFRQPINETRGTFDMHDPVAVKRVLDAFALARGGPGDALLEFWRMSILTGPHTHIVNTASNVLNSAYHLLPRRGVEAAINIASFPTSSASRCGRRMRWCVTSARRRGTASSRPWPSASATRWHRGPRRPRWMSGATRSPPTGATRSPAATRRIGCGTRSIRSMSR
jgi:hypothetical protein